jgi:periplasmic protein TonB
MAADKTRAPGFDDIVFENRNKEYGAYSIRKKYHRTLLIGFIIGIVVLTATIITPYFRASAQQRSAKQKEREVVAVMENLDQPEQMQIEAPPPPPPAETQQQIKYVAPEVVDSIKPDEQVALMTMDESVETVQDEEVVEVQEVVEEEVEEYKPPAEVFVIVEEMPSFPGGNEALLKYIYDNIEYPRDALENGIEGNVVVRFCVTYQGKIEQATVVRGIHPSLDAEAIRLINSLPTWNPGKQAGNPVNVWYTLRVQFQLLK